MTASQTKKLGTALYTEALEVMDGDGRRYGLTYAVLPDRTVWVVGDDGAYDCEWYGREMPSVVLRQCAREAGHTYGLRGSES